MLASQKLIRFTVPGPPQPQGSKTAKVLGKRIYLPDGKPAIVEPRAILVEQANKTTKTRKAGALDRWRSKVAEAARAAMDGRPLWDEPCILVCEFLLPRPRSHWTKSGTLRKGAPLLPKKPDWSKLVRAVEDALTGVVYRDDSQVVMPSDPWGICQLQPRKRYARRQCADDGRDVVGGVFVEVRQLSADEQAQVLAGGRANP